MSIKTQISSVERYPDVRNNLDSDVFVVKAGTAATIVRHQGDFTVIRVRSLVIVFFFVTQKKEL